MGEVYRARDPRLGRMVAIKVIPADVVADADRLKRFQQEARAVGSLNHPNILAVYDVGTADGTPYLVSELLEGETLREQLMRGPVPFRKSLEYGIQIAKGLAAAQAKGIIHRDLKPENLFITREGHVKILDFGLAKLSEQLDVDAAQMTTCPTEVGVIKGTVGYMSPEQVRGQVADHRSDLFSFGVVLYEMISGRRPFRGSSAADTMSSILKDDAPELPTRLTDASAAVDRLVRRCLEKDPYERFQSARDVGFALEAMSGISGPNAIETELPGPRVRGARTRGILIGLSLLAFTGTIAYLLGRRNPAAPPLPPKFSPLTFRRGVVHSARFSPDGQSVVYSAEWNGDHSQVFATGGSSPESRPLVTDNATVLAISSEGEMALTMGCGHYLLPMADCGGTLARSSISGAAPRQIASDVSAADWSPDGRLLAVIRRTGGRFRLEYPLGTLLKETSGWLSSVRISPDGASIAYVEHPTFGDDAGTVMVVDQQGRRKQTAGPWSSVEGLAWSPSGDEVWFIGAKPHEGWASILRGITLKGKQRLIYRFSGITRLHDISRAGRVLLSSETFGIELYFHGVGQTKDRNLSWLGSSGVSDLSPDGREVAFWDGSESASEERFATYIRPTDGPSAVKLGAGYLPIFSPDGKWVLAALATTQELVILPTGIGEMKVMSRSSIENHLGLGWLPDGKRIAFAGSSAGQGWHIYVQGVQGGTPVPVTPEILRPNTYDGACISPDGKFVWARDLSGAAALYPTDGGRPLPLSGLEEEDGWMNWGRDSRSAFVFSGDQSPAQVSQLNFLTGEKKPLFVITPADPAGVPLLTAIRMSADGKAYAYSYPRILSKLFVMTGLR